MSTFLSDILGYTSIACWLGAQFPQIVVNFNNKSAEGLALPFLINWLFGDISNLVGCILTNQLPFQTYLATYFCFVDICLVSQYFYYRPPTPAQIIPPTPARPREREPSLVAHRRSLSRSFSTERATPHIRALSNAAANVAAAAAQIALEHDARRGRVHPAEPQPGEEAEAEDEVMALTESFHSDLGKGKHISWRGDPSLQITTSGHAVTFPRARSGSVDAYRGRPLTRNVYESPVDVSGTQDAQEVPVPPPPPQRRRSESTKGSVSRRQASLVFLGVWALFGIGSITNGGLDLARERKTQSVGVVLPTMPTVTLDNLVTTPLPAFYKQEEPTPLPPPSPPPRNTDKKRIIGRISAWSCTTLYLTSRMPQIWKNFVRKSVEGLSIYLFIFAILGNSFYVLSLLASPRLNAPPHERKAYIREFIPYILGSGGTLVFDITILFQSVIYRGRAPRRGRTKTIHEEEESLLGHHGNVAESPVIRKRYGSVAGEGALGLNVQPDR